jgi:short subunit fatty acids transporter
MSDRHVEQNIPDPMCIAYLVGFLVFFTRWTLRFVLQVPRVQE